MNTIRNLTRHIPLTLKMFILTVFVAGIVWVILDSQQSAKLDALLRSQLETRLEYTAKHDRRNFDDYTRAHVTTAKLLASEFHLQGREAYLDVLERRREKSLEPVIYANRPPPWFPDMSLVRAFVQVRYMLLLNKEGTVLEVYQSGPSLPDPFLRRNDLFRLSSHNRSLITQVDGVPYLVASVPVTGATDVNSPTVMVVAPIDETFLFASQGGHQQDHIVTIISDGSTPAVLASSDSSVLPPGATLASLTDRYLITGKSFFDYGSSDRPIQFMTFIPTEFVNLLGREIATMGRSQREVTALVMILSFMVVMFWITRRLDVVNDRIVRFSTAVLGLPGHEQRRGDTLQILEEETQGFMHEIVKSRRALQQQADEKLLLAEKALLAEQQAKEAGVLRLVTEVMEVGVISLAGETPMPANQLMESFVVACGPVSTFLDAQETGAAELILPDRDGMLRTFAVVRPEMIGGARFVLVHDLTRQRQTEDQMQVLSVAVEQSAAGVVITDAKGVIQYVNAKFCTVTGYSVQESVGRYPNMLKSGEMAPEVYKALWEAVEDGREWRGELLNRKKSGELYWEMNAISAIRNTRGVITHYLAVKEDISEQKRLEEKLREIAITDELTGLLNRRGFMTLAEQQLKIAYRNQTRLFILFADLDGLKRINDQLGHQAGDEAIQRAADVLKRTFRDSDIIGRMGGDEYAVVVTNNPADGGSTAILERLEEVIAAENSGLKDSRYSLAMSTGVVYCDPAIPRTLDELISAADELMYESKKARKAAR